MSYDVHESLKGIIRYEREIGYEVQLVIRPVGYQSWIAAMVWVDDAKPEIQATALELELALEKLDGKLGSRNCEGHEHDRAVTR